MDKDIHEFVVFCMEYYKREKNLSGSEIYDLFDQYGVLDYLENGYDVLHTQGKEWLMKDIDEYLKNRGYEWKIQFFFFVGRQYLVSSL